MEQIYTAIQAAAVQDAAGFRDAISDALAVKIQDSLDLKKIEIAAEDTYTKEEKARQHATAVPFNPQDDL